MANTFSRLNIHCVFSTKDRVWVLNPDIRERLWPYMGLEHHQTRTFQEEYLAFLKKHGTHFDEKYLWD